MKKFGILICILSMSLGLAAQGKHGKDKKTPEEKATHRTEMMTKKLKLTDEQVPQVKAINLEFAQKAEEIRTSTEKGEDRKAKMESLLTDTNAKMKTVLTDDQYGEYLKMVEKQKERRRNHKKKGECKPNKEAPVEE